MPDNQEFDFAHKVYQAPGACFRLDRLRGEVTFSLDLGGVRAVLPVSTLVSTFGIEPDCEDARRLLLVEDALRYVKEVRPGDSIPSEILDGTSSWQVSEAHFLRAKARLTRQLVSWLSGTEAEALDVAEFEAMMDTEAARGQVSQAFTAAATSLGFGPDGRQKVVDTIEQLARELSYVESLREHLGTVLRLPKQLRSLQGVYRHERTLLEVLQRAIALAEGPIRDVRQSLSMIDAQTAEIMAALRNLEATVAFVRKERDSLRRAAVQWDEIIAAWANTGLERSERVERLERSTYRFIVTNFPMEQRWSLEV